MKKIAAIVVALLAVVAMSAPAHAKTSRPKASCINALANAEDVIGISGEFSEAIGTYFTGLSTAAGGGNMVAFMTTLNSSTETLTDEMNGFTVRLTPIVSEYRLNATKCRAGK